MLQKTYSIYSDDLNDVRLFVETGKSHIACWCRKGDDDVLRAFEFFQYTAAANEDFAGLIENAKLYSRLLTMPVASTVFIWNTDEAICVPKDKDDPVFLAENFDLLKGSAAGAIICSYPASMCSVAWRVKKLEQDTAAQYFGGSLFIHQFVALLPAITRDADTSMHLFFYPQYFTIGLNKHSRLHYINTSRYNTPADVLYCVLNVMKQYAVHAALPVYCGGFISEQSTLYETLYQYLEGFQLLQPTAAQFAGEEFSNYPLHYFSPYINYVV